MVEPRSCVQLKLGNAWIWGPAVWNLEKSSSRLFINSNEGAAKPIENGGGDLSEAGKEGREYVRSRLTEELKREPTGEEIDEWLRQHTESY